MSADEKRPKDQELDDTPAPSTDAEPKIASDPWTAGR